MIMMNQVSGPARLTLWRSKVEMLQLHYAGEGQYLEVSKNMVFMMIMLIMMIMMIMMIMLIMMIMMIMMVKNY